MSFPTTASSKKPKPAIAICDKQALHVEEACQVIGISRAGIYKLFASGELRSVKLAGRRLVPAEAIRALLSAVAA